MKNCIVRARKGVNVSGLEALSVALLLQMGQSVRRSITNTVQEFQDREAVLEPLLDMVISHKLNISVQLPFLFFFKQAMSCITLGI